MKQPSRMTNEDRVAYYKEFVRPLLTQSTTTRSSGRNGKNRNGKKGMVLPGTILVASLLLGCIIGWSTSWIYYRQMGYSREAVLQMHQIIQRQDAELKQLRQKSSGMSEQSRQD